MRTKGNFKDIFAAAKDFYLETEANSAPINPAVRRAGGVWMIESDIYEADEDCDVDVPIDIFHEFFHEDYKDDLLPPSNAIEAESEFVNFVNSFVNS